jgi:tRNA modification GTPase
LWFPGPASATGEDVAEFHVHGGQAILAALFAALLRIDDMRAAEPGEFTRRAFENGKLDLTEAEGLDDLIHAHTERQRRQALRQLKGLLGDRARGWRARLIEAMALVEAGIDFSDEGDVPAELMRAARPKIASLHDEIAEVLSAQGRSERLREGLVVAIAGAPNVGKSTLMNVLAKRQVAIVSPHAGTTRDVIEVQLDLDGYPVTLIDTAGIRDSDDPVEQEGVRRAQARAGDADLVLWLSDGDRESAADLDTAAPAWVVRNKIDLTARDQVGSPTGSMAYAISAQRGDGVPNLVDGLTRFAAEYLGRGEGGLITRVRQRKLLEHARTALHRSLELDEAEEELVAEELRAASVSLGRLLGRVDVEDVLGSIFAEFCVGK